MNLKGLKYKGTYKYRGKVEDILENKTIEVNEEVVEIKPLFHFRRGEGTGSIIYSIVGNKDLMVISNYTYEWMCKEYMDNSPEKPDICSYREFFYWDYERDKHIMDKNRLFKFISELEFLIYNNDIDEDDDYYKTIKDMKKYYMDNFVN